MDTKYFENEPHLDDERINRISDETLLDAFDMIPRPRSISELRRRTVCIPENGSWNLKESLRKGTPDERDKYVEEADTLLSEVDVTGAALGRSARYGWHYLTWLRPLVLAFGATRKTKYAQRFNELFRRWDSKRDQVRGEWPSLDVIWYSLGIAGRNQIILEAFEVIDDALSDEIWARMVKVLLGGSRWSHDEHHTFRHGNWQLACTARLLHVATTFPQFRESGSWQQLAWARIEEHVDRDFYDDGGHYERSPGYHAMCLSLLQNCALIAINSGDRPLFDQAKFERIHTWLAELTDLGGFTYHFQDAGVDWPGLMMLRGAALTGRTRLWQWARTWLGDQAFRAEADWLPATLPRPAFHHSEPGPAERISTHLDTSKYVIMRAPSSTTTLTVAVNYGPWVDQELESHSHLAAFDFIMTSRSGILLWEAGGPATYDDPQYHPWYQSTLGHNSVTYRGEDIRPDHRAVLDALRLTPTIDVMEGHHFGYGFRQDRTITVIKTDPAYVVVDDRAEVTVDEAADLVQSFHGIRPWESQDHGPGQFSYVAVDGESPARLRIMQIGSGHPTAVSTRGLARVPDPAGQTADYEALYSLSLHSRTGRFTTLLIPMESNEAVPIVTVLSDGFSIEWPNVVDTFHLSSFTRTPNNSRKEASFESM